MVFSFVSRMDRHLAVSTDGKAMTFIAPPTQLLNFAALSGGERIDHVEFLQHQRIPYKIASTLFSVCLTNIILTSICVFASLTSRAARLIQRPCCGTGYTK
jgi:hypothetical protein